MSEKYTPKPSLVTAEDCYDTDGFPGWASRVKSAIKQNGEAVKLGPNNSIQAKSLTTNLWQPIMLPGGGISFVDTGAALRVLDMVTGILEIPNILTAQK